MADAIKAAASARKKYGWKTYLIRFRSTYAFTFNPKFFPDFELIGEVNEEGSVFPVSKR